jgi:cation transport regulator ChaC
MNTNNLLKMSLHEFNQAGTIYSRKMNQIIPFANKHELLATIINELDPEVLRYYRERDCILYMFKGEQHAYWIDDTQERPDGIHWVEYKRQRNTVGYREKKKAEAAIKEAPNRGIESYSFIYFRDTIEMLERLKIDKEKLKQLLEVNHGRL